MKSMTKHSVILFAFFVACSLVPDTGARPNGINELFTVLAPSATAKPGTGDYTPRDFINDGMKNNLAFLNEICPPLARVADKLCQAVQDIVQRCINYFVNGGNMSKSGDGATTDSSTEGTGEETTPESGNGYDNSNPKFGGDGSSSSESSSESSTDKPSEKEAETTTPK